MVDLFRMFGSYNNELNNDSPLYIGHCILDVIMIERKCLNIINYLYLIHKNLYDI
jgi:hypothetical protein